MHFGNKHAWPNWQPLRGSVIARFRLPPWAFLLFLGAAIAAVLFSIDYYRHRFVRNNVQMLALLPRREASTFFVNVALLRRSGLLDLLKGSRAEDSEYQAFLHETGFDYTRDADAIAGTANAREILSIVRGRFNWSKLQTYARSHGGRCDGALCRVPTTKPERWISFLEIQSDAMALAVSPDKAAATKLRSVDGRNPLPISSQPVWLEVSQNALNSPGDLPLPFHIFALTLRPATRVVFSLGPAPGSAQEIFNLRLEAICPTEVAAGTVRNHLETQTRLLKSELAKEHQQPNPSDLTGLLTAGTFQVVGERVIGDWPVHRELLNSLR